MLDYSSDINSETYPTSGECGFWLRGESCGRTTCHECGAYAAAVLVANAAASITGVVVAARQMLDDAADYWHVRSRCMDAVVSSMAPDGHAHRATWNWWFHGLWEAASRAPAEHVHKRYAVPYALGRIAYVAWRNAREENRRV